MKSKTIIVIVLAGFLGLHSASSHAQSDGCTINMDKPNYNIDVERYCSRFLDFDNPQAHGDSVHTTYRYVKYTKDMSISRTEKCPILIYYINTDSLIDKSTSFCKLAFGKLNLITDVQGNLIAIDCKTRTNQKGFEKLLKVAKRRYGEPVLREAETGKDEIKNILINQMVTKGKNIPVYFWSLNDEYIGVFIENNNEEKETAQDSQPCLSQTEPPATTFTVKLFRAKKKFEELLIQTNHT